MHHMFLTASRNFLFNEYLPKIRLVVTPLSDGDIWWRPAQGSNSIGNLLLHIEGNARQWLLGGVGQQATTRDRDAEFSATAGYSGAQLVEKLAVTFREIDRTLATLTMEQLAEARTIQGAHTTVFDAIYHVVEHVSMHTGQIIQIAKWRAPGAIKLYDATSTSFTPLWSPEPRDG
jgi:uncharacterized damage-inducible protein DinB